MPKNMMMYVFCTITLAVALGVFTTDLIWGIADDLNINAPLLADMAVLGSSMLITSIRDGLLKQADKKQ